MGRGKPCRAFNRTLLFIHEESGGDVSTICRQCEEEDSVLHIQLPGHLRLQTKSFSSSTMNLRIWLCLRTFQAGNHRIGNELTEAREVNETGTIKDCTTLIKRYQNGGFEFRLEVLRIPKICFIVHYSVVRDFLPNNACFNINFNYPHDSHPRLLSTFSR